MTFEKHTGVAVPLLRTNINTDAIIPSREMRRVSKAGLGKGLFAGWRYIDRGTSKERENPDFELNLPQYDGASILLAGANMGCGSSREFAVWALTDYGIRAIIAPSFGAIFYTNCIRNGLLPIVLDEQTISKLADQVAVSPQRCTVNIDLAAKIVRSPDSEEFSFVIEPLHQQMLMQGLDSIDITMRSLKEINAYEISTRATDQWLNLP